LPTFASRNPEVTVFSLSTIDSTVAETTLTNAATADASISNEASSSPTILRRTNGSSRDASLVLAFSAFVPWMPALAMLPNLRHVFRRPNSWFCLRSCGLHPILCHPPSESMHHQNRRHTLPIVQPQIEPAISLRNAAISLGNEALSLTTEGNSLTNEANSLTNEARSLVTEVISLASEASSLPGQVGLLCFL